MPLEVGELVDGKYRIVRLIGEGGMGAVYEGEHRGIRRRVAIKVLLDRAARDSSAITRFEREAQAAGTIGNDHILEVLDVGSLPSGERFMVMEYLEGETLAQRIARGRLTPTAFAPIAIQFLSGLAAAHAAGVIHRDLKPDNVFILREKAGRPDFVKIIDFGISKFDLSDGMNITNAGALMGTPCYMSPEQARGIDEVDQKSDIYAAGVIFYEALTGKLPFDAQNLGDLLFKIVLSDAPRPRTLVPEIDPSFEAIIMKAMARERSERFATVSDMLAAVHAWVEGSSPAIPVAKGDTISSSRIRIEPTRTIEVEGPSSPAHPFGNTVQGTWATASPDAQKSKKGMRVWIAVAAVALLGGTLAAFASRGPTRGPSGIAGPAVNANQPPPAETLVVAPPPVPVESRPAATVAQPTAPPAATTTGNTAPETSAAPATTAKKPRPRAKPKSSTPDFGY